MKVTNSASAGVVFVVPRSSRAWSGAEAMWITIAGWASAAEKLFGAAWIVTTDRIASAEEVVHYPLFGNVNARRKRFSFLPMILKTLAKDFLLWKVKKANACAVPAWDDVHVSLVWEHHDLFAGPGKRIAKALGVPFVLFVHAPVVWETAKWGVKRPVWGKLLEEFFESKSLRGADVVACVSDDVAKKVISMGVEPAKVIVSPMAVDPERFAAPAKEQVDLLRSDLNLKGKFVVGWTGSFRSFHGLDTLLRAFSAAITSYGDLVLLMVGDGKERAVLDDLAKRLGIQSNIVFTGKVPFVEVCKYVSMFDIAIVSAGSTENFHYSPLKLREFLAAKKATIAPNAGEIPNVFVEGQDLLLYTVGDENDLKRKMLLLYTDHKLRQKLSENGFSTIMRTGTWEFELKKIINRLHLTLPK